MVDAVLFFLEDDLPSTLKKISLENPSEKKGGLLSRASDLNTCEKKIKTVNSLLRFPIVTGVFRDEEKNIRQFSAHYSTSKCPDVTIGISGRSRFFGFEISITGTEGRVCIGNGYLKLYHREKSSLYSGFYSLFNDRSESLPKKTFYFSNMIQNAVDFLDGKANLRSTLQTGINALSVLEEIKEIIK